MFDYLKTRDDVIVIEEQPKDSDVKEVFEEFTKVLNGVKIIKEEIPVVEKERIMITVSGKSLVNINTNSLQNFLNSFVTPEQIDNFSLKFDARPNVKSTFLKMDETAATIYTGAVSSEWMNKFGSEDGVSSDFDALMFLILFALKKRIRKESFDMKLSDSCMSYARMDEDFTKTGETIKILVKKFLETYPDAQQVVETVSSTSSKSKKESNPNKYVPLVDTPKIEVPDDLDLMTV